MRLQRNNLRFMPVPVQRLVTRLTYEGTILRDIQAEVDRQFPGLARIHFTTWKAWRNSPDYKRYVAARDADREENDQTRAMAAAMNDGHGPENLADLTVMEVVRELYRQTKGGEITDLADLANVTKALAPLLRAKIARDLADSRRREQDLAAQLEKAKIEGEAERISLEQEIDGLRKQLDAKQGAVDPTKRAEVIAAVDEFVAGNKH